MARGQGARGPFAASPLAPGADLSGHLRITPADRTLTPYIQVRDVRDSCRTACPTDAPALSDVLQVQVLAPNGTSWTKRLSALTTITPLAGGDLLPTSTPRAYQVTATLPRDVGNAAEGLRASFKLQWGLMDANRKPVTRVLGESLTHELPFTGSDVILELVASVASLIVGMALIRAVHERLQH